MMAEARQARLPGVEDPEIEEIQSAAEGYVDVRDKDRAREELRVGDETTIFPILPR